MLKQSFCRGGFLTRGGLRRGEYVGQHSHSRRRLTARYSWHVWITVYRSDSF